MPPAPRQYKYFEFVMAAFVAVYLCSNLIDPAKAAQLNLPLFGVVTFGAMLFASLMAYVVVALPPAPTWQNQQAYEIAFGSTSRRMGGAKRYPSLFKRALMGIAVLHPSYGLIQARNMNRRGAEQIKTIKLLRCALGN